MSAPAPHAEFVAGSVDDYVIRLELPGGVVHDCTLAQAEAFGAELAAALEVGGRCAVRDRRCPR
jgi:hypothetical protein